MRNIFAPKTTGSLTPSATPIPTEAPPQPLQQAQYFYDGDANMVKSVINGKVTYYPARHYQKEVDGGTETVKKYYAFGGQTVAVRTIQGGQDTLKWTMGDHLGSTSLTANADGTWNSEIKYTAFGEVRISSGITPTQYRYTGQLSQPDIGLYYYVARWYDASTGHFTQPDTVIPNPNSAQSWDRYSYAENNPISKSDPSGHYSEEVMAKMLETASNRKDGLNDLGNLFGVTFSGEGWSDRDKRAVLTAVNDVGEKFSILSGDVTSPSAFTKVFKNGMDMHYGASGARCGGSITEGGCVNGSTSIDFRSLSQETTSLKGGTRTEPDAFINARNNVVHEIGHAFGWLWGANPTKGPFKDYDSDLNDNDGWIETKAPNEKRWRQAYTNVTGATEVFADMFLGFTYNTWAKNDDGYDRYYYMGTHMDDWIRDRSTQAE